MDTAVLNIAGPLQLIGLAVIVVMVIMLGMRIAGMGPRGFSSAIVEVATLLVALWIIARPNDAAGMLSRAVGGVQQPAAIGRTTTSPAPPGQ